MVTDVNYICHDEHFTIYTNIKSLYYLSGTNIYVVWEYTSSVAQSCPTLQPHELQHTRPACPSPSPGVHSNSRPSSWWCHPTISSSVIPFSSCHQSFPASGSFQMSQLFTSGGQSIGASTLAAVFPMNIQGWFPLGFTGGGHGTPLQYSCLENPRDRGAWWATVHRVMKSRTWLKWVSIMHISTFNETE